MFALLDGAWPVAAQRHTWRKKARYMIYAIYC
jgi:hypothetical protein